MHGTINFVTSTVGDATGSLLFTMALDTTMVTAYWHPNPPVDRSNAPVKPDVWYTLKLKVHETPFTVTGEVYTENGTLLGSLTIDRHE